MKSNSKLLRWIYSTATAAALAGASPLCQAQSPVVYDFSTGLQGWSDNAGAGTYTWNATGGSTGGGCMQIVWDGVTTTQINPWVTLPSALNENQYLSVSIHMMVDPNSGTSGPGYGNLQAVFRNASYSWDSIWYGGLYPPAANSWVTYTFIIPQPYQTAEKFLQFQLQGSGTYSAPVTNYIDNVTISPVPNPWLMESFNGSSGANLSSFTIDTTEDAPFYSEVTGAGPTNETPAASWEIQISDPGGYNGWNQYQPSSTFDATRYQWCGFDIFLDGSSGSTYGGTQVFFFQNGWANPQYVQGINFNASMVGKWTHFNIPSAASGITASPAIVFQGTPGSDGGTDNTTFHVDNISFWNPSTRATIDGISPGLPGGVQMTVDADGTANPYDQEGIASPTTNNTSNFFWINQAPAAYSFTLTNFPSPAAAPGFDAHVYIVNGDTINANATAVGSWGYNQTYSGVPYNALDYVGLRIQNGLSGGLVAILEWKTNAPDSNPPTANQTVINLPAYSTANGTWTLSFSDNLNATITGPAGVVGTVTLPDFYDDPNYTGNFSPGTSAVQFGVAKNGNGNNSQSGIFVDVSATNQIAGISDNFSGPGINANNSWQTAEYYQDSANRLAWQPPGTAWLVKWNTTQSGWSLQSSGALPGAWTSAGVTYTYVDNTGTNTVGAVPAASLPAGNSGFFQLTK